MSTLQVENLIGPTSGSNANKVIIPSGQTLDASNGFTPPAGSVVQVQDAYSNTQVVSTTSGLAINGVSLSFTPKYGNSKLVIIARVPIKVINTGSQTDGWATVRIAKSTGALEPEPNNTYEFGFNVGQSSWNDWRNVGFVQAYDTVTNTNAETYSAQGKLYNGAGTSLTVNEGGLYFSSITIMEVKQ
jgi:hypothetical protein